MLYKIQIPQTYMYFKHVSYLKYDRQGDI
jgi:hypothetical protein